MAEKNDELSALVALIRGEMLDVNTCIEAVIVSYGGGVASVRPLGKKRFADGDVLDYPVIDSVPVRWPTFSGGSAGVKGPVTAGDKCLLVFSQQAIDGTDDQRRFDLNDAYAVMCDGSQSSQGGNNADMVMYFGSAYIALTPSGQLMVKAPGGVVMDAPSTVAKGTVTSEGLLTYQAGMSGTGGGDGTTISGTIAVTSGDVTADGISLKTHKHSGVTVGGGQTGNPV